MFRLKSSACIISEDAFLRAVEHVMKAGGRSKMMDPAMMDQATARIGDQVRSLVSMMDPATARSLVWHYAGFLKPDQLDTLAKEIEEREAAEEAATKKAAEEAAAAKRTGYPVPGTPWFVVWTGDRRSFFYNPTTKTSVWEKPADLVGRSDVAKMLDSPEVLIYLHILPICNLISLGYSLTHCFSLSLSPLL